MNVVPAHTHGFTTGGNNVQHNHSVNGTTGGMNGANPHAHGVSDPGHSHGNVPIIDGSVNPGNTPSRLVNGYTNSAGAGTGIGVQGSDINHSHSFGVTSGIESQDHVHSGGTDAGSSQLNWTPQYVNFIICQKS
jgi:hypothetical protein